MSEAVQPAPLARATPTWADAPRGEPAADGAEPSPTAPRPRRAHLSSAAILVVGLALSLGLAAVASRAVDDGEQRVLTTQLSQVSAALQAAIPAIQQPLVAADRIAGVAGVTAFRSFVGPDVGARATGAPFRSISLWRRTTGAPRLLAVVGQPPTLLASPAAAARALAATHPSTELSVIGLPSGAARELGFAESLPGTGSDLIVYAESDLPTPGSAFKGLDFALYLGRTTSAAHLLEATITLPAAGRHLTTIIPFGSADVTIVTAIVGRPPGVLPTELPCVILAVGAALTVIAALSAERLVRRRELAEAVASDRGVRYVQQRGIAQTLQRSLLPPELPSFPGVEVATRYVAGVEHLDVGGDWHDAIRIDDDHLFVTVGDVAGRGLRAATVMATVRHAIRAYAVQGDDPGTVLRKLGDVVDVVRDGCFATVLCAVLDVPRRLVTVASAGHLPPLVVDRGGARFLVLPVNTPVGVASIRSPQSVTYTLSSGTTLVFYTDGLVERRDRTLDEGLGALRRAAPPPDLPIERQLAQIIAALVPEGAVDDLAVLGLTWPAPPLGAVDGATDDAAAPAAWRSLGERSTTFTRRFGPVPGSVAEARAFVDGSLPDVAPGEREVSVLLTSELATNAVRHAKTDFEVTVLDAAGTHRVRVGVADAAAGTPEVRGARRGAPDGRGLQLVATLSNQWGVEWAADQRSKTIWFEVRT